MSFKHETILVLKKFNISCFKFRVLRFGIEYLFIYCGIGSFSSWLTQNSPTFFPMFSSVHFIVPQFTFIFMIYLEENVCKM
jgi:uncharacterized membrane protein YphA (DoxX/SURF4 family)